MGIEVAFCIRHGSPGFQGGKLQLQKFIFWDLTHFSFSPGHLVQTVGIHLILSGSAQCLLCRQQIEKVSDRIHGHRLRRSNKSSFRLFVTHRFDVSLLGFFVAERFDTAVPLQVVYSENGLSQLKGDRDRHELPASSGT